MRTRIQLKVIAAQLELLEERKSQAENMAEINSVIALCQAWIEEREEKPTSFKDLMKLCVKMAEMCPDDCQCSTSVSVKEMKENSEASLNFENFNTNRKHEENSAMEKILSRLDVLEKAVSILSSSNKVNEDNIMDVKKSIESFTSNTNERLEENEQKSEQARKEQSEQIKILHNKVKGQAKKVKSFTKLLKEMKEELVNDISSCNDGITSLQSNYRDLSHDLETVSTSCNDGITSLQSNYRRLSHELETVSTRCNQVESNVVTMNTSLLSLWTSHDQSCKTAPQSYARALEGKFKEQFEELVHDVSSCSETVTSLESKYNAVLLDIESLRRSCKPGGGDVTSSSQTSYEPCLFELMLQEHETKMKELQTKVQTLQEQMRLSTVLLLVRQNTLRDVFKKYVKKQKPHLTKIAHIESEILHLTKKCAVFKPNVGFIADNFTIIKDIEFCKKQIESMDSSAVDQNHLRNSGRILTCFPTVYSGNDDDYDTSSGIFTVKKGGLYLTCFHLTFYEDPPQRVNLAFIIRAKSKIAKFYCFKAIDVVAGKAQCMAFLNLSSGQELCLCTDQKCQIYALDSQFACILLA